jgi:hypothetical protein
LAFKATALFNAQYSPFLNPIEQFFNVVKRKIAKETPIQKKADLVSLLKNQALTMNKNKDVRNLWRFSVRNWRSRLIDPQHD